MKTDDDPVAQPPDSDDLRRQLVQLGDDCWRAIQSHDYRLTTAAGDPDVAHLAAAIAHLLARLDQADAERAVLRNIITNLPHRIFWKDRVGRILGCNDNFARDLGFTSPEDLLGKTDYDMPYPREQADHFRRWDRAVMSSGEPTLELEEPMLQPDGMHYLSTSKVPLRNAQGEIIGVLGIYVDITERKRADEERARLVERLQELDALKNQFFSNVSHELRTPLTLILGLTDRLAQSPHLDERERRDLATVARNGRILLTHVNDLLDVAKLEAGKLTPQYADVDLADLVRLTASSFEVLASERRISFDVTAPRQLPVQVDAEKVQRVLTNLLANAFKFTPPGGTVRCTLDADGDQVRLTVADSGPGVPLAQRQAIFERFVQGEGGANRQYGGTGLGLAIAREFVELHGGTLIVDDAAEGGARFVATLPRSAPGGVTVQGRVNVAAPAHVADQLMAATPVPVTDQRTLAAAVDEGEPSRPLVLVVEDNPEMSRFIAEALAGDFRIATAFDGEAGLAMAMALRPDVILSDVMMPRMSGDQLLLAIRQRRELDDVPVILLTAKADDALRLELLRQGAQDYIMKPFATDELRIRVANLIKLKRSRDLLQAELASRSQDLEALTGAIVQRGRELQTALATASVAREQAERASQLRSDFLRLVSHEFRSPLTSITLHLHALRMGRPALTPAQEAYVQKTLKATARLQQMVDSLLHYARIESHRLQLHVGSFDLRSLAVDVLDELRPQTEQKPQVRLRIRTRRPLPPMISDRGLVRLILINLIGNALKFTDRGQITIHLAHKPDGHRIIVRDTGCGIATDKLSTIFEPFAQLEPLTHKHKAGVGLGLTLVREVVAALGGRLDVASREGHGTTFTVLLPPAVCPSTSVAATDAPGIELNLKQQRSR